MIFPRRFFQGGNADWSIDPCQLVWQVKQFDG